MSRALKIGVALLLAVAAAGVWYARRPAPRPPPAVPPAIAAGPVGQITQLAPRLYLVPGGGCNSTVFVTGRGVVVVDSKYSVSWIPLVEQIRTITDQPITHVINTHRHPDHIGGNRQLTGGVHVVVQSAVAEVFREQVVAAGTNAWLGTAPIVVDRHLRLFEAADAIDLYYFGPAHTEGDLFVVFPDAKVMATGDVMPGKKLPTIVLEGGGNGVSLTTVLETALAQIRGVDRVVTGHGPVVPWQDFADYVELNRRLLDHVRETMHIGVDRAKAFKSIQLPEKFKAFDVKRSFETMDEIDRSLRPKWQRMLSR